MNKFKKLSGLTFLFSFLLLTGSVYAQSADSNQSATATRPRTVMVTPPQQQPVATRPATTQTATPRPSPFAPVTTQSPTPAYPIPSASPANNISAPSPVVAAPFNITAMPTRLVPASRVRARITEAERLLRARVVPTAAQMPPPIYFVTLAVLDPNNSQIHFVPIAKQSFLMRGAQMTLTSSQGVPLRVTILRANGVNTAIHVTDIAGRAFAPLVVQYPIERNGYFREMAYYTSAHPALLSPELVRTGQNYVRTMLDLAARRLRDKGIRIDPQLVDIAERLCLVEHVDHDRFRRESRRLVYDEVYSLYALNELDTYRYSVSTAGAGGMVQMIPSTYRMVRQRHPGVGLNPDFVLGMRNHGNALEAMLLYMQDTWNDLAASQEVRYALSARIATQAELMSAGYNSNPARLPGYLQRGGAAWRTLIPTETRVYLQIYSSVESLVNFRERSGN